MNESTRKALIAGAVALLVVIVSVAAGWGLVRGDGSLLRNANFSADRITPNADGVTDALLIEYEIFRNATVSIYFEGPNSERHYFRREQPRGADEYSVFFSGVVEGYRPEGEQFQGEILERLLQNGDYTWTIEAVDEDGHVEQVTGPLTIAEAVTSLPEMRGFDISRDVFTPNRDGIDDRVQIQFDLQKEANYRVYLVTPEGLEIPIGELERDVIVGAPGRHYFDYEGGVDNGETPPPDGVYTIVGYAEDITGQKMQVTHQLELRLGGVPRADIVAPVTADQVEFNVTAVPLCETLVFTLTVENYGTTPIRTSGPAPGAVYDSDWNYNTLGWHTESGVWRIAIGYEDEVKNYPFRWAVGSVEDLQEIDGHYYLMPGERAVVTGGIRIVGELGLRNPQPMWAGLIHEDVEIAQFNNVVDPKSVTIDLPDVGNRQPCPAREIPVREEE